MIGLPVMRLAFLSINATMLIVRDMQGKCMGSKEKGAVLQFTIIGPERQYQYDQFAV